MSNSEDITKRLDSLLADVTGDGRERPETNFYNVAWHVKQNQWRVKVTFQGKVFYKEFPKTEELVAAWVADVVGVMMKGMAEARTVPAKNIMRTGRTNGLNFDWSQGVPECPKGRYTIYDVYGWLVEKKLPVRLKPSTAAQGDTTTTDTTQSVVK